MSGALVCGVSDVVEGRKKRRGEKRRGERRKAEQGEDGLDRRFPRQTATLSSLLLIRVSRASRHTDNKAPTMQQRPKTKIETTNKCRFYFASSLRNSSCSLQDQSRSVHHRKTKGKRKKRTSSAHPTPSSASSPDSSATQPPPYPSSALPSHPTPSTPPSFPGTSPSAVHDPSRVARDASLRRRRSRRLCERPFLALRRLWRHGRRGVAPLGRA